jgi:hypothetical protein
VNRRIRRPAGKGGRNPAMEGVPRDALFVVIRWRREYQASK